MAPSPRVAARGRPLDSRGAMSLGGGGAGLLWVEEDRLAQAGGEELSEACPSEDESQGSDVAVSFLWRGFALSGLGEASTRLFLLGPRIFRSGAYSHCNPRLRQRLHGVSPVHYKTRTR